MTLLRTAALVAALATLAACEGNGTDKTRDFGIDSKPLQQLKAGIWIDPEGCDHWIIDDGFESYMSWRLKPNGKPVCSGKPGQGGYATGPYDAGSEFKHPFGSGRKKAAP